VTWVNDTVILKYGEVFRNAITHIAPCLDSRIVLVIVYLSLASYFGRKKEVLKVAIKKCVFL
jgi:hypothetical protein